MYLVNAGLLEPSKVAGHGVWKLARGGQSPRTCPHGSGDLLCPRPLQHQQGNKTKMRQNLPAPSGDDLQQDLEGTVNWQVQLKGDSLVSDQGRGFEHLCNCHHDSQRA